jgi:hypothetical protein
MTASDTRDSTGHLDPTSVHGILVYRNKGRSRFLSGLLLLLLGGFGWTWARAWQNGTTPFAPGLVLV